MLTSAAPEPHVQRFLRAAAAALCDHSVVASGTDPKLLVPRLDPNCAFPGLKIAAPVVVRSREGMQ